MRFFELLLGDLHAAGDVDGVALERERLLEGGEDRGLVVDDEEVRVRHGRSRLPRTVERRTRNRPGAGQRAAEPWHSRRPSDRRIAARKVSPARSFEARFCVRRHLPGRCRDWCRPGRDKPALGLRSEIDWQPPCVGPRVSFSSCLRRSSVSACGPGRGRYGHPAHNAERATVAGTEVSDEAFAGAVRDLLASEPNSRERQLRLAGRRRPADGPRRDPLQGEGPRPRRLLAPGRDVPRARRRAEERDARLLRATRRSSPPPTSSRSAATRAARAPRTRCSCASRRRRRRPTSRPTSTRSRPGRATPPVAASCRRPARSRPPPSRVTCSSRARRLATRPSRGRWSSSRRPLPCARRVARAARRSRVRRGSRRFARSRRARPCSRPSTFATPIRRARSPRSTRSKDVARPELVRALEAVIEKPESDRWLDLARMLRPPPRAGARRGRGLRSRLASCSASRRSPPPREAYRLDSTSPEPAAFVAAMLVDLGMGEAAPAVLVDAVKAQKDPRIVGLALAITMQAMGRGARGRRARQRRAARSAPPRRSSPPPTRRRKAQPSPARVYGMMGEIEIREGRPRGREASSSTASVEREKSGTVLLSNLARLDWHDGQVKKAPRRASRRRSRPTTSRRTPRSAARCSSSRATSRASRATRNGARKPLADALRDLAKARGAAEGDDRARIERLIARVLDRFGDASAEREKALERALEAAPRDKRQAAATIGQIVGRAFVRGDLAAARDGLVRGIGAELGARGHRLRRALGAHPRAPDRTSP